MSDDRYDEFRTHAIALREAGATHVVCGDMSVTFAPKLQLIPQSELPIVVPEAANADDSAYIP